MTVQARLPHIKCNLQCKYCYGNPQRRVGNIKSELNLEAVKEKIDQLESVDNQFVLSGGEPLLSDVEMIREIYDYAADKFDNLSMQTNLTLLEDEHIEIFKQFKVSVGVSFDGPGQLNDARWAGGLKKTRNNTRRTLDNLQKLKRNNIGGGIIITVQEANAGDDQRLEQLKKFILWLDRELDLNGGNLHMLNQSVTNECGLGIERNKEVFLNLAEFMIKNPNLKWKPFVTIKKMLQGKTNRVSCIWSKCDSWATESLYGIEPDGSVINCACPQTGFEFLKAEEAKVYRYISLYQTPQDKGGCKGCRYFLICSGNCPEKGQNADWRNKVLHCEVLKSLFEFYEDIMLRRGKTLVTEDKYREKLEDWLMDCLWEDKQPNVKWKFERLKEKN